MVDKNEMILVENSNPLSLQIQRGPEQKAKWIKSKICERLIIKRNKENNLIVYEIIN